MDRTEMDAKAAVSARAVAAEVPPVPLTVGEHVRPTADRRVAIAMRALQIIAALWLFIAALAVMKTGAKALAPTLEGSILTDSLPSTLGFGWLSAMLVMSGSPIAASALTLLDGGAVAKDGAFMMLTGSRLGAAFVVLTVAFIYALRGGISWEQKRASVSIGIFALVMTAVVYLPGMAIGLPLLETGAIKTVTPTAPVSVTDFIDEMTSPAVDFFSGFLPETALFFAGLVLLLVSLKLFDRVIPEADSTSIEEHEDWRSRKWVMFGLGSIVALVTMSVAVALTVLVPLVAKGHLRRRQALPYIMGANIMTLGDTLMAALIIGNPEAPQVVMAELVGVSIVTVLLLALAYRPLTEGIVRFTDAMLTKPRIAIFVGALFFVPIALIGLL
jgi:sodium-dependent phosphate cotransporter